MFKKLSFTLIISGFLFTLSGCGTYMPGKIPELSISDPNTIKDNNVAILVKIFDCEESEMIFDAKLCEKQLQPILIIINNQSDNTYDFRKINVTPNYVKALKVGKKCYRNRITNLAVLPWIAVRLHKINNRLRMDYMNKEIKDSSILSGEELRGILFYKQIQSGEKIVIPLFNSETGEKLTFGFEVGTDGSSIVKANCIEGCKGATVPQSTNSGLKNKSKEQILKENEERELKNCKYLLKELAKKKAELEDTLYRARLSNIDSENIKKEFEEVQAKEYRLKNKCPSY